MTATPEASAKLADDAERVYQQLRSSLETPDQIGKMIIIEPDSGDYEIDDLALNASRRLRQRHPSARFFGIRIGYKFAEAFGGGLIRREQ